MSSAGSACYMSVFEAARRGLAVLPWAMARLDRIEDARAASRQWSVRIERSLYQGRQCGNRSRNRSTGSVDLASSQSGDAGRAEGTGTAVAAARQACEAANAIEDINERRRLSASPLRDMRYFAERVRTAQVMPAPPVDGIVAFGSMVTFSRDDGRTQRFRIVGEDEADPASGTVSYVSPVARVMMGKTAGDLVNLAGREIEIIEVA